MQYFIQKIKLLTYVKVLYLQLYIIYIFILKITTIHYLKLIISLYIKYSLNFS